MPCDILLTLDGKRSVLSPRLGIGVYQCWAFQQKFKSAFGSLSTPEMGEKETGVSSALKPLVGVARRHSGVLLGVHNWQINVLPSSDLAPRLYGNQCLCLKLDLKQS